MKRRPRTAARLLLATALPVMAACASNPSIECREFSNESIRGVSISQARQVIDDGDLPDFCQVQGTIDPNIGFEARLPVRNWNRKFYQSGCGGYCGSVLPDKPGMSNTINEALRRGYAAITTDAGHKGGPGDASWARGDPVAVAMYAHESIPLTHQAGTALVQLFYGARPDKSYFSGCSNGGRMAAMAAQRYPTLFDGILGGAGVLNLSFSGGVFGSWVVKANTNDNGERVLTKKTFAHKLPILERAIIEQCDATDGSTDGLISAPRNCVVDIGALPGCAASNAGDCFTHAELRVLKAWYQGPRDSGDHQLFPGMPPGSERFWNVWFLDSEDRIAVGNGLGGDYAKYLGFEEKTPADYTAQDFDFDADPPRLAATARQLNATNADLRAFRDAGGKFIMWHGWADPLVLPDQSVAYYEDVVAELNGIDEVTSFFRLFMIPGHGHCWEMPASAPDQFDPIAVLEAWVMNSEAPDQIIVRARNPGTAPARIAALCPYPQPAVKLTSLEEPGTGVCANRVPEVAEK